MTIGEIIKNKSELASRDNKKNEKQETEKKFSYTEEKHRQETVNQPRKRRVFKPEVDNSPKTVIVGIDFGTSYTKVCYAQEGGKKTYFEFDVEGEKTYFLPTVLYYSPNKRILYFKEHPDTSKLKYFKFGLINESISLNIPGCALEKKEIAEICSVYFLACLINDIEAKIKDDLKTDNLILNYNMGCPVDNWGDKAHGIYDDVLRYAYALKNSLEKNGESFDKIKELLDSKPKTNTGNKLETVPELYAEALWFIEQPSIGRGIYMVLDIGGGTVDCASIIIDIKKMEKKTYICSANVMPLGAEIEKKSTDTKEFDNGFAKCVSEIKNHDKNYMAIKQLPYYTFGGAADNLWYHEIISQINSRFKQTQIPILKREKVVLNEIPDSRLVIADQLTRSSIQNVLGFPEHFAYIDPAYDNPSNYKRKENHTVDWIDYEPDRYW